jgi:sigma54-dependent transcription regulator
VNTEQLNAADVLKLVFDRAQWCRENGESDMRNILHFVRSIRSLVAEGKTREEVLAYFADDDED